MINQLRRRTLIAVAFVLVCTIPQAIAQTSQPPAISAAVDGVQMTIRENGFIKPGVPNLLVTFHNTVNRDINLYLGYIGGSSRRPCRLYNRDISCSFNFTLKVSSNSGVTRIYTFRGPSYVAGRLDPYIVFLSARSTSTLELGVDQFWSPATREYQPLTLSQGLHKLSLQFEGRAQDLFNSDQSKFSKLTYWKGTLTSNWLSIKIARAPTR